MLVKLLRDGGWNANVFFLRQAHGYYRSKTGYWAAEVSLSG